MKEADRSVKAAQRSIDDHGATGTAAEPRLPQGVKEEEKAAGAEAVPVAPNNGVQMHAVRQPGREP